MGYRLIAVDVDGTLLRSDGIISQRTHDALAAALAKGAHLAVATGRRRRTAIHVLHQLHDVPYFLLSSQGAVTWEGDQIVAHAHLPRASARKALEILARREMVSVMFSNAAQQEVVWVSGNWRQSQRMVAYVERGSGSGSGTPPLRRDLTDETIDEALEHDPIQLIVFDDMDKLEALNEELTGHAAPPPTVDPPLQEGLAAPAKSPAGSKPGAPPLWRVIFSRNQFSAGGAIEIVGPDTSKAHALDALCRRIGCTPAEIVAFGDNINDHEMLLFAGLGVCMANGTEEAKALVRSRGPAGRIAPSNNEDGIAVTLDALGMI
jgi:hydroxymethylpyrimidine pyrophosphatase-like HAD family hydrolase